MAVFSSRVTLRRTQKLNPFLIAAIIAALALITAFSAIALAGTKTGLLLGGLAALGPVTLYASLTAPLVFPFGAFILLTPFDNLLAVSSFGTGTRIAAVLSGASILLYLARTRVYVMPGRALVAWCLFFAWALASTLWSLDAQTALLSLATLLQLFILYVAVSFMPLRLQTLQRVIGIFLAGSAIAAMYGAYLFHQGQTGVGAVTGRLWIQSDNSQIDPNHFAASMLMPLVIALVGAVYARTWITRIAFGGGALLFALGIAFSASRGSALAVLVALVYLMIRSRKRWTIALTFAGSAVATLLLHGNLLDRFQNAASTGGAGRADIWKVGVVAFRDHWFAGAGVGNFTFAFDQAFLRVSQNYYTHWHRASHNIIIQVGVELGIIGLALFFYAWWCQARSLKNVRPESPLYPLRLALEASIVSLFFAGFFLNIMTEKYLWLAFIIVALTRNTAIFERKAVH